MELVSEPESIGRVRDLEEPVLGTFAYQSENLRLGNPVPDDTLRHTS